MLVQHHRAIERWDYMTTRDLLLLVCISVFCGCREHQGCTDSNALNHDPNAVEDDGSCVFSGCTDPDALNYDAEAVEDDGSCQFELLPVTFDGHAYEVVQIGEQVWFAENLRTTIYAGGDVIPEMEYASDWQSTSGGAWCVFPENVIERGEYIQQFGFLYNGHVVRDERNVCPSGWHVPSDQDWSELEIHLSESGFDGAEGTALKSQSGWVFDSSNGLDAVGFDARPSGARAMTGGFDGFYGDLGSDGYWWSSTTYGEGNWYRWLNHLDSTVIRQSHYLNWGLSIRCLRDSL